MSIDLGCWIWSALGTVRPDEKREHEGIHSNANKWAASCESHSIKII